MKKSKSILGLKKPSEFSIIERRLIIEEWLKSGKSKREIWEKYTGNPVEKGQLVRWMRGLGLEIPKNRINLGGINSLKMAKSKIESSPEFIEMKAKIEELERALINSELRATAYETMIDIAEKELKINIRKKSNTKQSLR